MEELTVTLTPAMLAIVPVVAAVVQAIKRLEVVAKYKQWLPFMSIGIAYGIAYFTQVPDPVVPSILIGLAASGGYDLFKVKKKPVSP